MSDLGGWMLVLGGVAIGLLALLELDHRLRPASPLRLETGPWRLHVDEQQVRVQMQVKLVNTHARKDVMLTRLRAEPTLLATQAVDGINVKIRVGPDHPDVEPRPDGYWPVSILKPRQPMAARVDLVLTGVGLGSLQALWLEVGWLAYGPFGHLQQRHGLVIPMARPTANPQPAWRQGSGCQVLPLATHLLGWLDDPLQVLRRYAEPHLQPGDVVALAETPLAVMQGRYRLGTTVEPSCLARQLCRVFHPHSSLATACGLQALIDLTGPARVLCAWLGGVLLRLLGIRGGFYRLAGEQARLIDDLTGTIPPYDRTIVLGPEESQAMATQLAQAVGHPVVVVDVNDLGRVKVIATSSGVDPALVHQALVANPAGNANEGTPLVIIRPSPVAEARP
ncbi:F420-0:Gamma-glutamyl ligase [Candidatus Synechococcus spongiarum]|uniref:ABC-type sugar transport system, periplasmic component n=1 Tax=Candidatus Synechococcus spongiarum TaxID=431041 RepID=A0A164ZS87_9SYNE|nr:F420-0:Gamma-glutamyl ligase [Candidatus Synechococcus spongiarum]SAY39220.1 ABC-type sugar transport system, periplasmic component [Candidatus Synechococcus spongiarum]